MTNNTFAFQDPAPGKHLLRFRGDVQKFTLTLENPQEGDAWLRTNIGHAGVTRNEIIREVDFQETPLGRHTPAVRFYSRRGSDIALPLGGALVPVAVPAEPAWRGCICPSDHLDHGVEPRPTGVGSRPEQSGAG